LQEDEDNGAWLYSLLSIPSYSTTIFSVLISSTDRPPSSAGLEARQQSDPQLMDEGTRVLPISDDLFEHISESPCEDSELKLYHEMAKISGHDDASISTTSGSTGAKVRG